MANGMGTGHNAMGTHGSGSQWYGNRSHSLVLRPFLKSDISCHMGRTILCTECHNCIYKSGTQFSTATAHTNYYTIARAGCKVFCQIGDLNTKIVPSPCEKNVSDHSGMGTDHSRHAFHLEVVVKANKEGERDGGEDPLLIEGVLHLLQLDHLLLVQDLEGVVGLGQLVLNQHHSAK